VSTSSYSGDPVLGAVETLTDLGSVGFYASAIVAATTLPASEVSSSLMTLVDEAKLKLRFELRCPDNGRRIAAYENAEEIPLGKTMASDRCESDAPFTVEETDVLVRFVPSRNFAALVRRRRAAGEDPLGGDSGKVRRPRLRRGRATGRTLR